MANVYWLGVADPVKQVTTITAADTWATGDTATIICNSKTVTVTLGTSFATTDVVATLAAAINAVDATSGILNDETRNRGGYSLGEFRDMVATASASTLTLTGAVAGRPFTVTRSEVTAGDGALGAVTEATAPTGPNHFDEASNWSTGLVPATTETMVFDSGNVSVLYGLDNAVEDLNIDKTNGYTGNIGLPEYNNTWSGHPYREYRQQYLDIQPVVGNTVNHIIGGRHKNGPAGHVYLDFGTNAGEIELEVIDAPAYSSGLGAAIKIVGGKAQTVKVRDGSVSLGADKKENSPEIAQVYALAGKNVHLRIGENATLNNEIDILQVHSGQVYLDTDCSGSNNDILVYGGTLTVADSVSLRTTAIHGGRVDYRGGAFTDFYVFGGELDFTLCDATTGTNPIELYRGSIFKNPYDANATAIKFVGCQPRDVTLLLKNNLQIAITNATSATLI